MPRSDATSSARPVNLPTKLPSRVSKALYSFPKIELAG